MTNRSIRALIAAVVTALLVSSCGFLDQRADQDIFASADLPGTDTDQSTADTTGSTTPPAEVDSESQPVLRVDVDGSGVEPDAASSRPASGAPPHDLRRAVSTSAPEAAAMGDLASTTAAARTTQTTTGRSAVTTGATTRPTTTMAMATGRQATTTAPTTRRSTTAAVTTRKTATTLAPTTAQTTNTAAPTTSNGGNSFATFNVIRLSDGKTVTFRSQVAPGGTPVLAWLWAPGCVTCMAEAPMVEQLAQQHTTRLLVASLAMTSRLESAQDFVDTYRVFTPLTLVDTGYALSGHYDVTEVPTWILFDAGGTELARGHQVNGRLAAAVDTALGD